MQRYSHQDKELTKTIGDVVALDKVSLEIERGTLTTFLGQVACGKDDDPSVCLLDFTVRMREIFFGGQCVNQVPEQRAASHKRNATMVFRTTRASLI